MAAGSRRGCLTSRSSVQAQPTNHVRPSFGATFRRVEAPRRAAASANLLPQGTRFFSQSRRAKSSRKCSWDSTGPISAHPVRS